MNDGINPDEFTQHYITVDQVIRMVSQFGQRALMAIFDVEAAYWNTAIHHSDRFLQSISVQPLIFFSCVVELVEWILVINYKVPNLLHYLDDFLMAGQPVLLVCDCLGLPLHPGKCVGPSPALAVLGIELDSLAQVERLPEGKLQALKELIHLWLPWKWCVRRELKSLIDQLRNAAKEVWPGRTFLRLMITSQVVFRKRIIPFS